MLAVSFDHLPRSHKLSHCLIDMWSAAHSCRSIACQLDIIQHVRKIEFPLEPGNVTENMWFCFVPTPDEKFIRKCLLSVVIFCLFFFVKIKAAE